MPLYRIYNESVTSDLHIVRMMKDQNGASVVLETTTEAIQDKGWPAICEKASQKFDNGQLESKGPPPKVKITTSDWL